MSNALTKACHRSMKIGLGHFLKRHQTTSTCQGMDTYRSTIPVAGIHSIDLFVTNEVVRKNDLKLISTAYVSMQYLLAVC